MTRLGLYVVGSVFILALGTSGCSSMGLGAQDDSASSSRAAPSGSGGSSSGEDLGGSVITVPPAGEPDGSGGTPVASGILTAGTWDDNQNFDFFMNYRAALDLTGMTGMLPIDSAAHESAFGLFAQPLPHQTLDIALVIDTTGSMGDEISYLQAEFATLASRIAADHPNAEARWSLVAYKDIGDEYVVRDFDFSSDLQAFQTQLDALSGSGGGDIPEAPDMALARAAEHGWRTTANTARLSFWVADAPHHDQNAAAMAAAIQDLQGLDVHVYPVASSGIDELTELTMRSAAQLTGGRYLFLTDDSGVGGEHKEPTIPCYYVTKLDDAILRMVDIELSGTYREPAEAEVLRTAGDPESGSCVLTSGESVEAY